MERYIYIPRSSWTLQFNGAGGGVIDSDYRGRVGLIFFNFSSNFYQISERDNVEQIIFQKISTPILEEVSDFEDKTVCGVGGFGLTDFPKTCRKDL